MALKPTIAEEEALVDKFINTSFDIVQIVSNGMSSVVIVAENITSGDLQLAIDSITTTNANVILTNADAASTAANAAATAADKISVDAALDEFTDLYLGAKASAPTLDNDGNVLVSGAIYFDEILEEFQAWNGNAWITPYTRKLDQFTYTATASQTTFTGVDDNAEILAYTPGFIGVHLEGVFLEPSLYTATNGTSIVLNTGANVDDIFHVTAFGTFSVSDVYTKSEADATYATKLGFYSTGFDDDSTQLACFIDAFENIFFGQGTSMARATGAQGVMHIKDAATNPAANPVGGIVLYSVGGVARIRDTSGIIQFPVGPETLVGRNTTDTLTNKIIAALEMTGHTLTDASWTATNPDDQVWDPAWSVWRFGDSGAISTDPSVDGSVYYTRNAYNDGNWKRLGDGNATMLQLADNGSIVMRRADSGVESQPISWGNTLDITNTGLISGMSILDDPTMDDNSAQHLVTQQSVKAYVDSSYYGAHVTNTFSIFTPINGTQYSVPDLTYTLPNIGFYEIEAVISFWVIGTDSVVGVSPIFGAAGSDGIISGQFQDTKTFVTDHSNFLGNIVSMCRFDLSSNNSTSPGVLKFMGSVNVVTPGTVDFYVSPVSGSTSAIHVRSHSFSRVRLLK